MNQNQVYQRLRWRCRRGMRELDYLLGRWLERHWMQTDASEQAIFEALLECQDDLLWRWFMGYEVCPNAQQAQLIARISASNPL